MASRFSVSGWRTSSIVPKSVSTQPPGSPALASPAPQAGTYSAQSLARSPSPTLRDPSLASRAYGSTVPGTVQPALASSVYQRPEVPAYLAQAVSDLNTGQSLQRSLAAEWQNKIFNAANDTSNPNNYLFQESLRAASVNPGSHVSFGAAVQNPLIGQGYQQAAQGYARQANAAATAIGAPNAIQQRIAALQNEQQQLGSNAFGQYSGSRQQAIHSQLYDLQAQLAGANQVAGSQNRTSGWTSQLPY